MQGVLLQAERKHNFKSLVLYIAIHVGKKKGMSLRSRGDRDLGVAFLMHPGLSRWLTG